MRIIGLTGGIATGKSTVSTLLSSSCTIIDADLIARSTVAPGSSSLASITNAFGPEILNPDGTLNRPALGKIIFADKAKRKLLESITHPRIIFEMIRQVLQSYIRCERVCVVDVPLLFEGRLAKWMSEIWVVNCSLEMQITRLMLRDGISEEEALVKIGSQMPLESKVALADRVIENGHDRDGLKKRVNRLIRDRTSGVVVNAVWWILGVVPVTLIYIVLSCVSIYY